MRSSWGGWDLADSGWDLAEWLERLTANAVVATVLGTIPESSDTVEFEGRQMQQCWISYIKRKKSKKSPFKIKSIAASLSHRFFLYSFLGTQLGSVAEGNMYIIDDDFVSFKVKKLIIVQIILSKGGIWSRIQIRQDYSGYRSEQKHSESRSITQLGSYEALVQKPIINSTFLFLHLIFFMVFAFIFIHKIH